MIRLRSKKLLSGVSALAVLATFGVVDPVLAAGTTVSGPGNVDPINTTDILVGDRDFVNIDTNANVGVDGSGRSFYNPLTGPGTVTIGGTTNTALQIDDSILQGSIVNAGILTSDSNDAVNIANSIIHGALVNTGLINSDSGDGIEISNSTLLGGINNSGTIVAESSNDGINIGGTSIIQGGITNSGTITGDTEDGIDLESGVTFSGGIRNTGSITTNGSGDAIESDADVFTGGITNSSLIRADETGNGIGIGGGSFAGGIQNLAGGIIDKTGASGDAINVSGDLFQGGITNAGSIVANVATANAIQIGGDTFQGGITNSGFMQAHTLATLFFNGKLFQGGIQNLAGGIIDSTAASAVQVSGTTFQGGFTNQGSIEAALDGLNITSTTFQGGIRNAGTIDSTGTGNAIDLEGSTFQGGITNTGTLWGGGTAPAVLINGNSFAGGIINSGSIVSDNGANGLVISGNTFDGGVNNQAGGLIIGDTNAISISGTTFAGGITNAGQIGGDDSGTANDGINFTGTSFTGGINNLTTGIIQGSNNGIDLTGTSFDGGITNAGLIESTNAENAIVIGTSTFTGGINNTNGGIIRGDTAINIQSGVFSFDGGITNAGLMDGTATSGVIVSANTFSGGINNTSTGVIEGDETALRITNDTETFSGGLTNAGIIRSTGAGAGNGVEIDANNFTGGVTNSGTIKGLLAEGLLITSNTFAGGLTNLATGTISGDLPGVSIGVNSWTGGLNNAGLIEGTGASGIGVLVNTASWQGDFVNTGTITGDANDSGVAINATTFTGNFDNQGTILGVNTGAYLNGVLWSGNVSNSGSIDGGEGEGLTLDMALLAGDVTNTEDGIITGTADALKVLSGTTITGDVSNDGSIVSSNQDAIDVNGVVQGALNTSGYVYGDRNGIDIDGEIQGGIFVTGGSVIGNTEGAIDLDGVDAAHTLTQTGGLISDNQNAVFAINMVNVYEDTFFANGGNVQGDILGGGGEGDDMITQSGVFAWEYGTGSGLDEFDVDGGTAVYGAEFRGDTGGEGVTVNTANSMNVDGWAYLHGGEGSSTTINLVDGYVQGPNGTLEFFLTTDTDSGDYGRINSTTINLDGNIAAYIDPVSFAAVVVPTTAVLAYDDVLNPTGTRTGTFDNSASILTSSIFFVGKATYDNANGAVDGDVNIEIQRLAFNDALNAIGATETQNQESVAAALETIYTDGLYSGDFQDFLEVLFSGGLTGAQFQAILDDIGGAEHAQVQGGILASNGILNNFMGERLDSVLLTEGGTRMNADLAHKVLAQAAETMNDGPGPRRYGSHGLARGSSGVSIWTRVFGQWDHNDGDAEAASYDQDFSGLAGGLDFAADENATIGIAGGWNQSDIDFDTPGDSADLESWQVGLYGSYGFGRFYLDGFASYSSHDVETVRTIFPPVDIDPFTNAAAYDASAWSIAGEVGGIWRLGRVDVIPSAALVYTGTDTDGFTEIGTGPGGIFDLIVSGADADSLASTLALRGTGVWMMGRTQVVPDIKIGWRHEFSDDRYSFVGAFSEDPSTTFTIVSSGVQEDSAVVSAGATVGLTQNVEVFFDFNGNYGSDLSQSNASFGGRFTW